MLFCNLHIFICPIHGTALSIDGTACPWMGGYHEWVTTVQGTLLSPHTMTIVTTICPTPPSLIAQPDHAPAGSYKIQ
jgi:hypothetical protein